MTLTSDSPASVVSSRALSLALGQDPEPAPQGSGYIAFDVPVVRHGSTGDAMQVRLVRREGALGSLSVTIAAADLFRSQGVQSFPATIVTFEEGELTKVVNVPVNSVVLDGEAHFRMTITGNSIIYTDIRWGETNLTAVIDDGSIASDGVVLDDPTTQILQNSLANDTIVYLRDVGGAWDDASVAGYASADPYSGRLGTVVINKNNLVIRNYPGDSPRFITSGTSPFHLVDSGYVMVHGLEAGDEASKNTRTGIYCDTEQGYLGDPVANGPYIIDSCHLHHIYGADNTGGVRLDATHRAVVFNCLIHDTYDTRYSTGNPYTSEVYPFHSGVHGYEPRGCMIYQNTIYNCQRGVYQKTPNRNGGISHLIARNLAYNLTGPLASFEHQGAQFPGNVPANDMAVFENVVLDGSVVSLSLHVGSDFSQRAKLYGNTCIRSALGGIDYVQGVRAWNNLITGAIPSNRVLTHRNNKDISGASIVEWDFNGYESAGYEFILDRYATDSRTYASLTAWQSSQQESGYQSSVVNIPDANAVTGAVVFADAGSGNYRLAAGSAYKGAGKYGDDIGAYRLGHEQIGRAA